MQCRRFFWHNRPYSIAATLPPLGCVLFERVRTVEPAPAGDHFKAAARLEPGRATEPGANVGRRVASTSPLFSAHAESVGLFVDADAAHEVANFRAA